MLPVSFCPFCLSSVLDMARQMLDINDEEEKDKHKEKEKKSKKID